MNNKSGQTALVLLMICVVLLVIAIISAPALIAVANESRTSMSCSSATDWQTGGACLILDVLSPYFIIGVICVGIFYLGAKLIIEGA